MPVMTLSIALITWKMKYTQCCAYLAVKARRNTSIAIVSYVISYFLSQVPLIFTLSILSGKSAYNPWDV